MRIPEPLQSHSVRLIGKTDLWPQILIQIPFLDGRGMLVMTFGNELIYLFLATLPHGEWLRDPRREVAAVNYDARTVFQKGLFFTKNLF